MGRGNRLLPLSGERLKDRATPGFGILGIECSGDGLGSKASLHVLLEVGSGTPIALVLESTDTA
jgi:hypothetical protein